MSEPGTADGAPRAPGRSAPDDTPRPDRWRWGMRALGLVLGGSVSLAFPEANLWWWAWVGLVPILVLVAAAADRREALWRSWAAGSGFFLGLHHWMVPPLGPLIIPAGMLLGFSWLPFGWAAWWLLRRARGPRAVAATLATLPSIWVATEVARSFELFGGTWGALGLSQWQVRPVLALAALGGVWALSAVLVTVNVALALALTGPSWRRSAAMAAVVAVLVGGTLAWGAMRGEPEVAGHLRVAGIQPGLIHDPAERLDANLALTRGLHGDRLDLVVWGQSSVGFDPRVDDEVRDRLEGVANELGVDVLVNVDARGPGGRISKTAVLIRPGVGLDDRYVKQRLVPFGEYIPLRPIFGWIEDITDAAGEDRMPGTDLTLMRIAGVDVGPIISYESTFPDMRRTVARMGAQVTVVQAASTTFQGSWAQPQQASFEAVRAVESGRPAVMVAVSGTSAAFDAVGRELAWVPSDATGAFTVEIPLASQDTPYVRLGDWVPAVAGVIVAVAAGLALARYGPPGRSLGRRLLQLAPSRLGKQREQHRQ